MAGMSQGVPGTGFSRDHGMGRNDILMMDTPVNAGGLPHGDAALGGRYDGRQCRELGGCRGIGVPGHFQLAHYFLSMQC